MWIFRVTKIPSKGIKNSGSALIQIANITGRNTRGCALTLPKGFDYENKKLKWYHRFTDPTILHTSQENAKIVVIEGPIGAGKTAFAKVLAEQLDMKHMPAVNLDPLYVLPSGYDLRQHDAELPKEIRSYDYKNFCRNPNDPRVFSMQYYYLCLKYFQYLDAMCHILNTGQGVVLERSYFSDYVFVNVLRDFKYITPEAKKVYDIVLCNTSSFLFAPHLIIYLDMPVPVVQERIRIRNLSYEQNSPLLTKDYLTALEKYWKHDYLKKASEKSEILIYDWSDGGDVDFVIDDIENINFELLQRSSKFTDWEVNRDFLFDTRKMLVNDMNFYLSMCEIQWWTVPELNFDKSKYLAWDALLERIPECKYDLGYNYFMKNESIFKILFKTKLEKHRTMRNHFYVSSFF